MSFRSTGISITSLIAVIARPLIAQQFLSFPLADASVPVWHGWFYDNGEYHGAVDYLEPLGTPILAAADGIAMASSQPVNAAHPERDTYGTFVLIKHPNGFSTLYAHLLSSAPSIAAFASRYNSSFGSWTPVKKGEVIGFVGLSGVVTTTRSHLHFEVARNSVGDYSGHVTGRVDAYNIYHVGLYYPPVGHKAISCGPNLHWLNCPIATQEVVFQPGPDTGKDIWTTSVFSNASDGNNFPGGGKDDYELVVGGWGDWYYSLLLFELAGLPKVAQSASLELFCFTQRGTDTTGVYLDRIQEFWDWKTQGTGRDHLRLWWADRPAAVQWIPQALPPPTVGQWYTIDITDLYNAWQSDSEPNYGIELRPISNDNRWAEFYSSDYTGDPSLRPKLVIKAP